MPPFPARGITSHHEPASSGPWRQVPVVALEQNHVRKLEVALLLAHADALTGRVASQILRLLAWRRVPRATLPDVTGRDRYQRVIIG